MNTTDDHQAGQPLGLASTEGLGHAPKRATVPACPFAVFDEFGRGADDRVQDYAAALVTAERERWKAVAIEACNRAGDGPDNGCCPTYWEEAREACIAAIQKA